MDSLTDIFNKYNTDKNSYAHNYTRQYEDLLKKYRNSEAKYLEIGVFNGGSIKAMREALKNSKCILGIDINPSCKQYEDIENNIFVEIGDATDHKFIDYIYSKYGSFDIVLDDGSHINKDCIKSFELLFPLLNNNGIYIIEDTTVYKYQSFNNNEYPNILEYCKKFIDFLNQTRFDSTEGTKDFVSDPFKIIKKTDNIFEYSIDKIEFGNSFVAVHKYIRQHWIH